jgi:hypothetical protein
LTVFMVYYRFKRISISAKGPDSGNAAHKSQNRGKFL